MLYPIIHKYHILKNLTTKMDAILEAKNDILTNLNKLEEIQNGIVKDVDELKQSLRDSQQKIEEQVDRTETVVLTRRIEVKT